MAQSRDIQKHDKKQKMCAICRKRPALTITRGGKNARMLTKRKLKVTSMPNHDTCIQCFRNLTQPGGRNGKI